MKDVEGVAHVDALAEPARGGGIRVDVDAVRLVLRAERPGGIARERDGGRDRWYGPAAGMPERQLAVLGPLDPIALLVHGAVVAPTQQGEVRQCRGPAAGPVADVVALADPRVTAGEATDAVAVQHRAA